MAFEVAIVDGGCKFDLLQAYANPQRPCFKLVISPKIVLADTSPFAIRALILRAEAVIDGIWEIEGVILRQPQMPSWLLSFFPSGSTNKWHFTGRYDTDRYTGSIHQSR